MRPAKGVPLACAVAALALAQSGTLRSRARAGDGDPPAAPAPTPARIRSWNGVSAPVVAVDRAGGVWTRDGQRRGEGGAPDALDLRLRRGPFPQFDGIASDGRDRVLGTRIFAVQTTADAEIGDHPAQAGHAEMRARGGTLTGELGWGGGGAFTVDVTDLTEAGTYLIAGLTNGNFRIGPAAPPLRGLFAPIRDRAGVPVMAAGYQPYVLALDARGRVRWNLVVERLGAARHLALDRRSAALAVGGTFTEEIDLDPAPGPSPRHRVKSGRQPWEVGAFVSVLSVEKRGRFAWGCALVGDRQSVVQALAFDGRHNLWILAFVAGGTGSLSLMCPEPAGTLGPSGVTGRVLMAVAPPGKLVFAEELPSGAGAPYTFNGPEEGHRWGGGPVLTGRAAEGVLLHGVPPSRVTAYALRGRRWSGDVGDSGLIDLVWERADGTVCAGVSKWDNLASEFRSRVGCFEPEVTP
jgi:hypothetical protein